MAVVEHVCGLELQAGDVERFGVVGVVVDVGVEPRDAPDLEAEYHKTSGATSRLSEEHSVGRWLLLGDVF